MSLLRFTPRDVTHWTQEIKPYEKRLQITIVDRPWKTFFCVVYYLLGWPAEVDDIEWRIDDIRITEGALKVELVRHETS